MVCKDFLVNTNNGRKWYVFIIVSVGIYFFGLVVILIGRQLKRTLVDNKYRRRKRNDEDVDTGWYVQLKEYAASLETGRNWLGRLLVVMAFGSNMVAFGIYIYYTESLKIEFCDHDVEEAIQHITLGEFLLYFCFLLHYLLNFIIASDKLTFWVFNAYTYIEVLTIPTVFTQRFIDTGWIGFRFLRVIYIRKLPQILAFLNILDVGSSLQVSEILSDFVALLFSAAGVIHLCENTGDFWHPHIYQNAEPKNYFDCVYFMVVTFSTVGYGDISCKTYLGRVFSMVAILIGLGSFASLLPAVFDFVSSHTKYTRKFKATYGKKHVVVTGHITDKSVASFIQDFLHPDRQCESSVTIVFLSPEAPSVVIQSILHRHCTSVFYFIGSVYKLKDCRRVMMDQAAAVIVLCDKKCKNPEAEDAENITRVISMKKYFRQTHIRCIVQLMRRESKANLQNFQLWNEDEGYSDGIVCIDELKLGFMAQSCNAPGFSTLLANLFVMRKNDSSAERSRENWKQWYLHGVSCEIYSTKLSNYFVDMTFPKAAEICFEKLKLLLIAVELKTENGKYFAINPKSDLKIVRNTTAFLIAQDSKSVSNAHTYCGNCHNTVNLPRKKLLKCGCDDRTHEHGSYKETRIQLSAPASPYTCYKNRYRTMDDQSFPEELNFENGALLTTMIPLDLTTNLNTQDGDDVVKNVLFDETGTYVWCEPRKFLDVVMTVEEAEAQKFTNHVVVLVVSDVKSPSLGLRQLIQPLRASNQPVDMMMEIVLLGDVEFLALEWKSISTFPDVYVVKGSPYRQLDLYAVNVHLSNMCILLSPCQGVENVASEEEALCDKEVIMVTLTLKAMKFDYHLGGRKKQHLQNSLTRRRSAKTADNFAFDLDSLDQLRSPNSQRNDSADLKIRRISGESVRMMTELVYDSNTLYLDDDEDNMDYDYDADGIWSTQPYACGSVFSDSVLDFLASATYFNRDILTLVRHLVTGSINPVLDEILSHGRQPYGTKETPGIAAMRNRCRVEQRALTDPIFNHGREITTFGELFLGALKSHGALCLGLYRLHRFRSLSKKSLNKRYVINFPPHDFTLIDTDLVFVLLQFETNASTII